MSSVTGGTGGGGTSGLIYRGVWDANANVPALPLGTEVNGDYYIVSVAGNTPLSGIIDWEVGDWAIYNGAAWQKIDQTEQNRQIIEFHSGVIPAVTRYLDREKDSCTSVPVRLEAAAVLIGLTVRVNVADAVRSYIIEAITNPGGAEALLGSIALPAGATTATVRSLAGAIPLGTDWGAKVRRTAGLGASTFHGIRVEAEVSMP